MATVQTFIDMKVLNEGNKIITITCKCGSTDFYRDEHEATICKTYLEGYFNCSNCSNIISYTDDNFFVNEYIQTKLF